MKSGATGLSIQPFRSSMWLRRPVGTTTNRAAAASPHPPRGGVQRPGIGRFDPLGGQPRLGERLSLPRDLCRPKASSYDRLAEQSSPNTVTLGLEAWKQWRDGPGSADPPALDSDRPRPLMALAAHRRSGSRRNRGEQLRAVLMGLDHLDSPGGCQRMSRLAITVSRTEAITEMAIIARHPMPPPSGSICTRRGLTGWCR